MEFGEGADRAPRKEEVGHYSSPLVLRENRHSRPIQPSRFPAEPLLTPDPPCRVSFSVHRRVRFRSLSADTCDVPLNGHPRPMPTHRSLSGSAVISLSCEKAYGAARGVRGADLPS